MKFMPGDKLKYIFPDSVGSAKSVFVGIVDFVGDTFVTLRSEQNTLLKVSFKNFHLLEKFEFSNGYFASTSENYFG